MLKSLLILGTAFIAFALVTKPGKFSPINVEDMRPGMCAAGSRIPDEKAPRAFGRTNNYPENITANMPGEKGAISLVALPDKIVPCWEQQGMRLLLCNRTDKIVAFRSCESVLKIIQQAKNESGEWKDIEHFLTSTCGNSYYRVFLPSGQYWAFAIPKYSGSYTTKLRAKLLLNGEAIYSNEYDGSINTSQFKVVTASPFHPNKPPPTFRD